MSVINTNVKALAAQESMRSSNLSMSQAMERLSTGKKINSAKDDAAGLAISNRMTAQIRGMAKAIQNSNDAISMTQTAEGAYGNVNDILQRMREITVQAASGTNNDADRASLQLEVKQLQSQIDIIANNTNHNNIKLLDGSASNVIIQTDTKAGNTMALSFDSVKSKDIGVGSRATLQAAGGTSATATSLQAGALLLNGILVGASLAVDDSASTASASASAIAKVAAINKVANLSGVYAKVEANTVSGATMVGAAVAAGSITINGVTSDSFTTTTDTSQSRKNAVNAINAKSTETGVVAIDTGDDTLGVTLTAADGRNIDIVFNTATTSSTGVRAASTNVGSYSLYTLDNRDIVIDTVTGSNGASAITATGLRAGTYKSNVASTSSFSRNGTLDGVGFTAAPTTTTGLLDSGTMIINGVAIGAAITTDDSASDTIATGSTRAGSAIAIAAAINKSSSLTGVSANANPNIVRGTGFVAITTAPQVLFVNGTSITVNTSTRNGVVDSINAYSGQTGVVASAFGEGLQLVAADGRNISLATSTATTSAFGLTGIAMGTTAATATAYYSQVTLSSDKKFTLQAGKTGLTNFELLGFRQGTYGGADNGMKVNQIDISSISGATQALTALDAAIETVSRAQAKSGALNNRLDSIINNLTETSSNVQASRSRIMDTDYAIETTNLAKQQIISQAATAMLAQANQQGQSVLSLLK
jgi:flagellin